MAGTIPTPTQPVAIGGWKSKLGAALVALSAILPAVMPQLDWLAPILLKLGGALSVVGLAHKAEKVSAALNQE